MFALQARQNGGFPSWYCQPLTRGQGLLRPKEAREEDRRPLTVSSACSSCRGIVSPSGGGVGTSAPAGSRACGAGPPARVRSRPQHDPPQRISRSGIDPFPDSESNLRGISG